MAFFRRPGIRLVIYLDDPLIVGSSSEERTSAIAQVIATLESLDFSINFKKSEIIPSQQIEYLGLITDSRFMFFRLTDRKIADISRLCKEALKKGKCSLRSLAKILGNLNWATYAVPFTSAHYHNLQALLIAASRVNNDNLDVFVCLDNAFIVVLSWWVDKANFTEGKGLLFFSPRCPPLLRRLPHRVGRGFLPLRKDRGPWTLSELDLHINALEFLATLKTLECFISSVKDCAVTIEVDNSTAVSYINRLGDRRSKPICSIALHIAN